jgi:hypothetical protein
MATPSQLMARIIDLFGPAATASPTALYGNLMVSPSGNILLGQTADDGVHKLQVTGNGIFTGALRVSGTPGLVFTDGSYQALSAAGKNRVINGSALYAQLSTSVAAGSAYTYGGVDRFVCCNIGAQGGFTQSQAQFTYGGITRYGIMQKVTSAVSSFNSATVWSGIQQILEGYSVWDLVGQPISLQFIFYTNVTGTFTAALVDSGAAHSYVTTFSATAGIAQLVQLTFPASSSLVLPQSNGAGMYLIIGSISGTGYQAPSLNTWTAGNYGTSATATNWAATVNNYILATDIQLEVGPVCTSYERRLPAIEQALVQRFVEQIPSGQYAAGGVNGTTIAYMQLRYQPKRITPTSITGSAASTFTVWTAATGNIQPSALAFTPQNSTTGLITATITGATAGQAAILENNSGSYINVLAEF